MTFIIKIPEWLLYFIVVYTIICLIGSYDKPMQGFELFKRDWNRSFKFLRRKK